MDYIPDFVNRKLGLSPIEYDLPEMEEFLSETYGVTVYQEQVMLLSRKLASFTKGEADKLRKAMGKKQIAVMMELKDKFMRQGVANGHPEKVLDKIWKDWEKFAQYAFNKSHATCYAWVSYQTAWLKCHYPAEFLAANLSCNLSKADEIKKIMEECKSHKVKVLNPDINESVSHFTVNSEGNVRFGLGGIKGFGSNVVDAIIEERQNNGPYTDVFDFMERVPSINRKSLECLVYAGGLDSFGYKRSQFFSPGKSGEFFIDEVVHYADLFRKDAMDSVASLFGEVEELKPQRPEIPAPPAEEDQLAMLQQEKALVGMYISSHPLDCYSFEIENFTDCTMAELSGAVEDCEARGVSRKVACAGIVTAVTEKVTKSGSPFGSYIIEDFDGSYELTLFSKDYEMFQPKLKMYASVFIEGEIREKFRLKPEEKAQGKKAPYGFKVSRVSLLGNLSEDLVKDLTISVLTTYLSADFRKSLVKLLKEHKGPTPLHLFLVDPETKYNLEFVSKKYSVAVNTDMVEELKRLGVSYKIGRKQRSGSSS